MDFTPGQQHVTNIKPSEEAVVNITDIRHYDPPTTLAVEGCEWVYSPTTLQEAELLDLDMGRVKARVEGGYFEECEKLVKNCTKASRALAYNWRHRRLEKNATPGGTWPLGLLDSRTIKKDENTASIFTKNNYKSHFSALKYSPEFKFYYVDKLTIDEALLFVDYDSAKHSELSGLAHGAFQDHKSPKNAPLRRSIEVRVLVCWEKDSLHSEKAFG